MADDMENDDQWLYGDNNEPEVPGEQDTTQIEAPADDAIEDYNNEPPIRNNTTSLHEYADVPPPGEEPLNEPLNHDHLQPDETQPDQNGDGSDNDKVDYDEDSDDDVNVVIGDFTTTPAYSSLNIKRGGLLTTTTKGDKLQTQPGKFTVDEFEQAGLINGIPVSDFNLDNLEDKPWRKPGADITDYFNYGFNEDTWRAYCERQKRMRVNESGTGLLPLNSIGIPRPTIISVLNDNSSSIPGMVGVPLPKMMQPKENVIQVMTADRREYSRKPPPFPDMSVPPPTYEEFVPEFNFNPEPEPFYGGFEPTQDIQWGTEPNVWQPQEIKTLTSTSPDSALLPPPLSLQQPSMAPPVNPPSPIAVDRSPPIRRSRSRERESSRRELERPRDRERSHRRERSHSRSTRHKSRSRSASRSHRRKKKSKRREDSE